MPGRDGMGPQGMGAMTGRSLGLCRGANATMFGQGQGQGQGQGRGRGFRAGTRVNNRKFGNFSNATEQGSVMDEMPEDVLNAQK